MRKKKSFSFFCIPFIIFSVFIFLWNTSCVSGRFKDAGSESLVEARIVNAVNAERNKWNSELSAYVTDGIREIDERIDLIEGEVQQVIFAAGEYRRFVISIIDGLQQVENQRSVP